MKRENKSYLCKSLSRSVTSPLPTTSLSLGDQLFNNTLFLLFQVSLLLFKPRRSVHSRGFQLDMELLKCQFKLLLIASKVGSHSTVEQDQLIAQHFNLWTGQSDRSSIIPRAADRPHGEISSIPHSGVTKEAIPIMTISTSST